MRKSEAARGELTCPRPDKIRKSLGFEHSLWFPETKRYTWNKCVVSSSLYCVTNYPQNVKALNISVCYFSWFCRAPGQFYSGQVGWADQFGMASFTRLVDMARQPRWWPGVSSRLPELRHIVAVAEFQEHPREDHLLTLSSVMFVTVPSAKTSFLGQIQIQGWRDGLHLLIGRMTKIMWLPSPLPPIYLY